MRSLTAALGPRRRRRRHSRAPHRRRPACCCAASGRDARSGRGVRFDRPAPRGVGLAFTAILLAAVFVAGACRGGQYRRFVAEHGGIGDFLARALGFGIAR